MAKRVAIVGSGCLGLAALWAIKTGTSHQVHLFEADSRLGGRTNTATFEGLNGQSVEIDTGFMFMSPSASPNLVRFLQNLGVPTEKLNLTFGLSRDRGTFEWANTSWSSVFAQRQHVFNPAMWKLVFDIIRFNEFALDLLQQEQTNEVAPPSEKFRATAKLSVHETVEDYLAQEDYSQGFRESYLIPMVAAIWRITPEQCLQLPAGTLVRFLYNHGLLRGFGECLDCLTVPSGSKQYVNAVLDGFPSDRIHLGSKVTALTPTKRGSVILTANQQDYVFDHVILAINGDQALELLRPVASTQEAEILGGFRSSRNVAVLHADTTLMPKRRRAWAALNCITESAFPPSNRTNMSNMCVTYWMNSVQHIAERTQGPILVTLNPLNIPNPKLAQGIWEYPTPLYNATAIKSQRLLPKIQNIRGISYCGAWTGDGFYEDALRGGLSIAIDHLGAKLPFEFVNLTTTSGKIPRLTIHNYLLRLVILLVQIALLLVERAWIAGCRFLDQRIASRRKLP